MGKNTREKRGMAQGRNRKKKQRRKHRLVLVMILLLAAGGVFYMKILENRTVPSFSKWFSEEDYPESLVAFAKKYPQAEEFVRNYPKKKDLHRPIDISGEVTKGVVPLFLQWDERWGYERYGDDFLGVNGCGPTTLSMVYCGLTGDSSWNPYEVAKMADAKRWGYERYGDDFLGVNGCGPTTLSMVYCGLTGDSSWNPYEVAKMADANGYYVSGVGSSWDLMNAGAQKLGLTVHEVGYSEEEILNALKSGLTLVCSMGPGDFTYTGHFVALIGIDSDGKIIVRDCNSPVNSEKTWGISELMPQIAGVWGYSYENV